MSRFLIPRLAAIGWSGLQSSVRIRDVQPELLETFPSDHPAAVKGREDLLLVNAVMGNHRWMESMLRRLHQPGWHITEIGAGDGELSLRLHEAGLCDARDLHGLDLAPRPARWPAEAAWSQGDLFQQSLPESEILIANLILHHFRDEQLRDLGARISTRTRFILAAEPERRRIHGFMGHFFSWLAELHPITRYDMQVSIRAGFRGDELRQFLGLGAEWKAQVRTTLFGGYRVLLSRSDA